MKGFALPVVLALAPTILPASAAPVRIVSTAPSRPEAKPFGHPRRAAHDVEAAIARARASGHRVVIVFGANWCHDSRALAGWFATPRFSAMLAQRYEVVWVDVGRKDRNLDLARRFGLDGIGGTPTVLILDSNGTPRNLADAPSWRDASTRSEDAIFAYFAGD